MKAPKAVRFVDRELEIVHRGLRFTIHDSRITKRGQMLIVVLWVIGLVSLAMGALTVRATHEVRLGRFPLDQLQRQAIAQAGVQQAITLLHDDDPAVDHLGDPWATGADSAQQQRLTGVGVGSGTFSVGVWDGGMFHVGMIDEQRKLNLNTADLDQLYRLIELVQVGDVDPHALATAIVDWRDEGTTPGLPCDGLIPACHNQLLDSVDELRLVPGMTSELFTALEPYVTVYGDSGLVNVNTADPKVLQAVGVQKPLLQSIMQQRQAPQPFLTSPDPSNPALGVTSTAFSVPVEAELTGSSGHVSLTAVINRAGCGPTPPEGSRCILAWFVR